MPDLSSIIKYCISVNNKSGSIPAAPQGMMKLKESIEGLPFELLTKSMSGIFDKLPQQINQLMQNMGGIQNMGANAQSILGQLQNGTASVEQITQAFGGVTSMTAGLSSFLSESDLKSITDLAPGAKK